MAPDPFGPPSPQNDLMGINRFTEILLKATKAVRYGH